MNDPGQHMPHTVPMKTVGTQDLIERIYREGGVYSVLRAGS